MRCVVLRSLLLRVNNTLQPPSPESHESPLETGPPAQGPSTTEPHSSPGPPMIPPVEMPDPKSDNPASSERNRQTIGRWFRTMMTKRSHNRAPRRTPSEVPHRSGIPGPSQTKAIPPKEKPSTMAPGKRQAVSVSSSVDTGDGCLTARLSGRFTVVCHRLVHASYPFMIVIPYHASQKKAAPKPVASSQPPKTTAQPEAGSSDVANETTAESGAQHNEEARVHFMRFATRAHNIYYSEKLGDHRRTGLIFPSQCRYPLGFVVAV